MEGDATVMLAAIAEGDRGAAEELLALVYDELRRLAASKLAHEAPGQTLQPTALVHEAWLRLIGDQNPSFKDRTHFFRASAESMRRILIDRARRKKAQRHGGGFQRVPFDLENFDVAAPSADEQLLAMNEALDRFALEHPVQADLVKLRYFAGLTNEEVAEVLGVSLSTVKNYWAFSRACCSSAWWWICVGRVGGSASAGRWSAVGKIFLIGDRRTLTADYAAADFLATRLARRDL